MSIEYIRVVLVDDHAIVRSGLKAVLGSARDIEVVGEANNGKEALAQAEAAKTDAQTKLTALLAAETKARADKEAAEKAKAAGANTRVATTPSWSAP